MTQSKNTTHKTTYRKHSQNYFRLVVSILNYLKWKIFHRKSWFSIYKFSRLYLYAFVSQKLSTCVLHLKLLSVSFYTSKQFIELTRQSHTRRIDSSFCFLFFIVSLYYCLLCSFVFVPLRIGNLSYFNFRFFFFVFFCIL